MKETRDDTRTRSEAAAWFTRLGRRAVTTQSLRDFRAWRKAPANDTAYANVEQAWSAAGGLSDDPEIRAATVAALARRPLRARLRDAVSRATPMTWGFGGLVAAGLLAAALAPGFLQPVYRTGVGEQRLVVLKDGSRVRLNTDSRIRIRFGPRERRIALLRGEAYFEAAHDASRPFLVDAGLADVRALGTRFDVRRNAGSVEVTLVEGRVRVREDGSARPWTLAPSQQITVAPGADAGPHAADAARVTSWTAGRLMFHDTPLAEAVAEVNRYSAHKVELRVPALSARPVSGVFDTGDTKAFVAAVTMLFDLQAAPAAGGGTVLTSRDR